MSSTDTYSSGNSDTYQSSDDWNDIITDIQKFFNDIDAKIEKSADKNQLQKDTLHTNIRYSLNKMYKNIKMLSVKYDVGYRLPHRVKEIVTLRNYGYEPLGKRDWIVYTDKGDFIYLEDKGKWYLHTDNVYETQKYGKSIKQDELINILCR